MGRRSMICLLLAAVPLCEAASSVRVAVEAQADNVPPAWKTVGQTARTHQIELTFAVKQQNVEKLNDVLMRVSTPTHPDYGMHLSNEEVHKLVTPLPAHIVSVLALLESHGAKVQSQTPNMDLISAVMPVDVAEKMLSAKYVQLVHDTTGNTIHRTIGGYTLPADVAAAVDFVAPTVHIPGVTRPQAPKLDSALNKSNSQNNVPKTLRQLYSVGDAEGKSPKNKQAVTAFLKQYYDKSDLQEHWSKYCSGITCGQGSPKLVGDATTGNAGVESMLDIETITGVAGNIESEFWGFSGTSPDNADNEPFMKWLTLMSTTSDTDIPKVFSTSYGEDESSWSKSAADRLNTEFMKAGARGISLLYASGDEGANCESSKYVPEGPGSSPYVTAVGGTQPTGSFPAPGSEQAVGLSSGGFSDYWAQPDWQKAAVKTYLGQSGLPAASRGFNTSGRGYPDIAAQAVNFCVTPFGCGIAGTSCATPTASAIFSLLNDLRLQNGQSTLGFLNPFIYQNGDAFFDVTAGRSSGCGFTDGWPAKAGWDAVTGMGTPNYAKLAKVVASLPSGKARSIVV